MKTCPNCGCSTILRAVSGSNSRLFMPYCIQYYRCTSCNSDFREFMPAELLGHILRSTGHWYVGFAFVVAALIVILLNVFIGSDADYQSVVHIPPF